MGGSHDSPSSHGLQISCRVRDRACSTLRASLQPPTRGNTTPPCLGDHSSTDKIKQAVVPDSPVAVLTTPTYHERHSQREPLEQAERLAQSRPRPHAVRDTRLRHAVVEVNIQTRDSIEEAISDESPRVFDRELWRQGKGLKTRRKCCNSRHATHVIGVCVCFPCFPCDRCVYSVCCRFAFVFGVGVGVAPGGVSCLCFCGNSSHICIQSSPLQIHPDLCAPSSFRVLRLCRGNTRELDFLDKFDISAQAVHSRAPAVQNRTRGGHNPHHNTTLPHTHLYMQLVQPSIAAAARSIHTFIFINN